MYQISKNLWYSKFKRQYQQPVEPLRLYKTYSPKCWNVCCLNSSHCCSTTCCNMNFPYFPFLCHTPNLAWVCSLLDIVNNLYWFRKNLCILLLNYKTIVCCVGTGYPSAYFTYSKFFLSVSLFHLYVILTFDWMMIMNMHGKHCIFNIWH